jgi:general secretion pathway protein H
MRMIAALTCDEAGSPVHRPPLIHEPMSTVIPAVRTHRTNRLSGFTLMELLVVVVIIGIIISAATLAVGVLGGDREVEDETRRVWALLQQAREEAELQSLDLAIYVAASSYEFLRFDPRLNMWVPLQGDSLYAPRELPEGLRFRVWLESREIVLRPALPERTDEEENKKWPPQIMVLSSGEVAPVELSIERDGAEAEWRVVAQPDNDLRVEQRGRNREWSVVAQTKAPEEDAEERG